MGGGVISTTRDLLSNLILCRRGTPAEDTHYVLEHEGIGRRFANGTDRLREHVPGIVLSSMLAAQ